MTIINPNPPSDVISREELDARYWMNQTSLPPTPDDIYNIYFLDKMIKVKKAKDYPFGSVAGFTQEQEVMERFFYPYINKESIFVDIGACWGQYSVKALALGAQVIAFEPDPRMVKGLRDNVKLNGFESRFRLYDIALGHENGIISFDELVNVPLFTLDSLSLAPSYIKIDVEHMESLVIEGAVETLKRYHPKLLIECHAYMGYDRTREIVESFIDKTRSMVRILKSLGYKWDMGPEVGRTYFVFISKV